MHSLGPLPPHYRGFCPTLSLGCSPPLSRWSANRAAHTLGGRCPIITRAAAPSLPGPLPHHYQGRCPIITRAAAPSLPGPQPTMLSLVCQQGCTLSLGPLPHHYQGPSPTLSQGRSPPWAHWFANRDARTLMAHGPSTARASAGLLSEPQPTLLLWVCHQGSAPPGLSVSGPQPTRPCLAHPQVRVHRGAASLSWL